MTSTELVTERTTAPWVMLRLDGHHFSKLTVKNFQKPFDPKFHKLMIKTAQSLAKSNLAPIVFTASDEISVLLPRPEQRLFDGRLIKLLTINAAQASSVFSLQANLAVEFDCKIFELDSAEAAFAYIQGRQVSAKANSLNDALYWFYRKARSPYRVHNRLQSLKTPERKELLGKLDLPVNYLPAWAAQGTLITRQSQLRNGFNPKTKETTVTYRNTMVLNDPAPTDLELLVLLQKAVVDCF